MMNTAGVGKKYCGVVFSILQCFYFPVAYLVQLKKELAELLFVSSAIWPAEKQIGGDPGSNTDPEFF